MNRATPKQLKTLERLGVDTNRPLSVRQASDLIATTIATKGATEGQKKLLKKLGRSDVDHLSMTQASALIKALLPDSSIPVYPYINEYEEAEYYNYTGLPNFGE